MTEETKTVWRIEIHERFYKKLAKLPRPEREVAAYYHLSPRELRQIEDIVRKHEDEFKSAWNKYFAQ